MIPRLLSLFPGCALVVWLVGCASGQDATGLKHVQRVQAGNLDVVVLSAAGAFKQGKDSFVLEFRSRPDQTLLDVGAVKVSATMVMAGMPPMMGDTAIMRSDTPGRYAVTTELNMAGSWRLGLEWDGPAGKGSTTFQWQVQ